MSVQGRETLPVAISDLEQRKQNEEEILAEIGQSLANSDGLSESSRRELVNEQKKIQNYMSSLAILMARHAEKAA